jgi:hypothetical protein
VQVALSFKPVSLIFSNPMPKSRKLSFFLKKIFLAAGIRHFTVEMMG